MTDTCDGPVKVVCSGPVYFADQGIEVCDACGGCTCCDFEHLDHTAARFWCWPDPQGVCHLRHEHSPTPQDTAGGPLRGPGEAEDSK